MTGSPSSTQSLSHIAVASTDAALSNARIIQKKHIANRRGRMVI